MIYLAAGICYTLAAINIAFAFFQRSSRAEVCGVLWAILGTIILRP